MSMKKKLTSRKFWMALAAFVAGLLALFQVDANTVQQISGVVMSLGAVIAYIVGEGLIDSASAGASVTINGDATITGTQDKTPQTDAPVSAPIDKTDPAVPKSTPTGAAQAAQALQSAVEAVQVAQKVVGGTAQAPASNKGAA